MSRNPRSQWARQPAERERSRATSSRVRARASNECSATTRSAARSPLGVGAGHASRQPGSGQQGELGRVGPPGGVGAELGEQLAQAWHVVGEEPPAAGQHVEGAVGHEAVLAHVRPVVRQHDARRRVQRAELVVGHVPAGDDAPVAPSRRRTASAAGRASIAAGHDRAFGAPGVAHEEHLRAGVGLREAGVEAGGVGALEERADLAPPRRPHGRPPTGARRRARRRTARTPRRVTSAGWLITHSSRAATPASAGVGATGSRPRITSTTSSWSREARARVSGWSTVTHWPRRSSAAARLRANGSSPQRRPRGASGAAMSIAQRSAGRPSTTRSGRPGPSNPAARQRSWWSAGSRGRAATVSSAGPDDHARVGHDVRRVARPVGGAEGHHARPQLGHGQVRHPGGVGGGLAAQQGSRAARRRPRRSGRARRAAARRDRRPGRRGGRRGGAARASRAARGGVVDAHGDRACTGLAGRRDAGAGQGQRGQDGHPSVGRCRDDDDHLHGRVVPGVRSVEPAQPPADPPEAVDDGHDDGDRERAAPRLAHRLAGEGGERSGAHRLPVGPRGVAVGQQRVGAQVRAVGAREVVAQRVGRGPRQASAG